MADKSETQEKEYVDKFLSNAEALEELKRSSEEDATQLMSYGIEQTNAKTLEEFGEEFLELMNLYPNTIKVRDISSIIKKIEVETE